MCNFLLLIFVAFLIVMCYIVCMKIVFDELKAAWDAEDIDYFNSISDAEEDSGEIFYYRDNLLKWIKLRTSQWQEICGRRITNLFICALLQKKYKLAQCFEDCFDDDYFGELKIRKYLFHPYYKEQMEWFRANTDFFKMTAKFWKEWDFCLENYSKKFE